MRAIYVSPLLFLLHSSYPLTPFLPFSLPPSPSPKPLSISPVRPDIHCGAKTPDNNNPPHNPILYRLPPPPPNRIFNIQSLNLPTKLLFLLALYLLNIPKIPRIMRFGGRGSFYLVFPFRPKSTGTEEMERAKV
jgi:hypothetical protein